MDKPPRSPFGVLGTMLRAMWAWPFSCILFLLFLNLNWFSILSNRLPGSKEITSPERFRYFSAYTDRKSKTDKVPALHAAWLTGWHHPTVARWNTARAAGAWLPGSPPRLQLHGPIECGPTLRTGHWGGLSHASSQPGRQTGNGLPVALHEIRGQMRNALWQLLTRLPTLPWSWKSHRPFH